jgi:hypothetical protein
MPSDRAREDGGMVHRYDREAGNNVWVNDGRWGPKAARVAHPGYVEYIERLLDHGLFYEALGQIRDHELFYKSTEEFRFDNPQSLEWYKERGITPPRPWRVAECPEAPSPLTDAERRHLAAYALRAAAQVTIAIADNGYWVESRSSEEDPPYIRARIKGLPLTDDFVELLVHLIDPPGVLKGETHSNPDLEVAIAQAVERNPKISNRNLAKKLDVSEHTIRRYRK